MDIILKLLLAHFIADYPLQPGALVAWKKKSVWGILTHTLIHLGVMIVVMWPYMHLDAMGWALSLIFIVHNLADFTKIHFDRKSSKNRVLRYWLDQLAHYAAVLAAYALWLTDIRPQLSAAMASWYGDVSVTLFLLVLILATYTWDVTRWTHRNAKKPRPYIRDWKGMGRNAVIVTAIFGLYLALIDFL